MDKTTRSKFIELDKKVDKAKLSKLDLETKKRKEEHYSIIESDNYANIIRNF